ncbi:hypothetical protein Tco_0898691, partial [Tanacetum coccineum]
DGGNTGDGVKIAGGVIGSGDEIEFSEELKELLPNEAGKESDETEFETKEVKEAHESDVRHLEGLLHDVVKLGAEYG